jgi:hypothetical protein
MPNPLNPCKNQKNIAEYIASPKILRPTFSSDARQFFAVKQIPLFAKRKTENAVARKPKENNNRSRTNEQSHSRWRNRLNFCG